MKKLIVTADDFGYSAYTNKAIIECFRKGIVTSTSLLVNTKYFNESVKLLKQNKKLDIGIHVNLTEFRPLTKAKTLTENDGNFAGKAKWLDGYFKDADKKEIEKEIEAQIIRAISSGLKITHINGHNHIHIFPKIAEAVIKLARKYGIKYIRMPDEKAIDKSQRLPGEIEKRNIASKFSKLAKSKILKNRLKATNAFYGILDMSCMDFERLSRILSSIDDGASELMVHPSYMDKKGSGFHNSGQRETEISLLTSKKTMRTIKKLKIKLTNFSTL